VLLLQRLVWMGSQSASVNVLTQGKQHVQLPQPRLMLGLRAALPSTGGCAAQMAGARRKQLRRQSMMLH
jgi:hypothetical protein